MLQPELRPGSRTRSRTASSAGSLDAPPPAAPAGAGAAVSLSLSAQLPPAYRGRQAQEDAGEGKEEAVEVGEMVGVSNGSTARVSSNVHGGHGHVVNQEPSTSELTSGRAGIRGPHSVLVSSVVDFWSRTFDSLSQSNAIDSTDSTRLTQIVICL